MQILHSWAEVLGHFCISWGLFQFTEDTTPPPTPQTTLDTSIENASTLDTTIKNCVGWGKGELQENLEKDALFNEGTQKLQKIMNTLYLSQGLLYKIVAKCTCNKPDNLFSKLIVSLWYL